MPAFWDVSSTFCAVAREMVDTGSQVGTKGSALLHSVCKTLFGCSTIKKWWDTISNSLQCKESNKILVLPSMYDICAKKPLFITMTLQSRCSSWGATIRYKVPCYCKRIILIVLGVSCVSTHWCFLRPATIARDILLCWGIAPGCEALLHCLQLIAVNRSWRGFHIYHLGLAAISCLQLVAQHQNGTQRRSQIWFALSANMQVIWWIQQCWRFVQEQRVQCVLWNNSLIGTDVESDQIILWLGIRTTLCPNAVLIPSEIKTSIQLVW